jgi:hypothetical protein
MHKLKKRPDSRALFCTTQDVLDACSPHQLSQQITNLLGSMFTAAAFSSQPHPPSSAREAVKRMAPIELYRRDLLELCLHMRPGSWLDKIAQQAETREPSQGDPEPLYYQGSLLAYCGKNDATLREHPTRRENRLLDG